jgi:hypothetical protein
MKSLKIVSGGQTGVDRAALDVALELGIPRGGWCPRGRRAEDGAIPQKYPLQETESENYHQRTKRNVQDSDATLVLNRGELDSGTAYTVQVAETLGKPYRLVSLDTPIDPEVVARWLKERGVHVLNVAGPRESKRPGIYEQSFGFLWAVLKMTVG